MLDNAMLDVAIGLVFLFLTLSLICTTINEVVSTFLKLRARTLRKALGNLLDDDDLRAAFENSPLIRSAARVSGGVGPSYLPPALFATALIDATKRISKTDNAVGLDGVRSSLQTLPDSDIKSVLLGLAETAETDAQKYKNDIATWFDNMMDRAAGRYKRSIGAITIVCAITLSVALNADSIEIAKALWIDESLRTQLVETAETFATETEYADDLIELSAVQESLRPFPLGWRFGDAPFYTDWYLQGPIGWLTKLLGLLITTLAISLGAPFWFDLLSKLVKLRGSGDAPKRPAADPNSQSG